MTFKYHNLFLPTNIPISFYNTKENIIFVVKLNQYVMDISKFSKAEVLATLYNRAKPQGLGLLQFDPKPMTIREAEILLAESANHYFDYVKGRVLKVNLAENKLNTFLYNRDNGHEAAEKALSSLR